MFGGPVFLHLFRGFYGAAISRASTMMSDSLRRRIIEQNSLHGANTDRTVQNSENVSNILAPITKRRL